MDLWYIFGFILFFCGGIFYTNGEYKIGVGIADCTGPAVEIVFMGYAKPKQKGCGIHLRQFSRAFIFDDGNKRVCFVSVDAGMIGHGVKREIINQLNGIYGDTYRIENLILSGTHTHAAPGGFLMDLMLDIPSFGFVKETFNALVNGIMRDIIALCIRLVHNFCRIPYDNFRCAINFYPEDDTNNALIEFFRKKKRKFFGAEIDKLPINWRQVIDNNGIKFLFKVLSIQRAHDNMVDGNIYLIRDKLLGANINRSPTSYLLNPPEEREKYKYDVDKDIMTLKLVRAADESLLGSITWFAVHPTSMNNTNCLVSSDNVGYASILLEKSINKQVMLGKGPFVGAFASTNLGDVSPNIQGARCVDTGEKCEMFRSTCNHHAQNCYASGPGKDMFESTEIIAGRLFQKAKELLKSSKMEKIQGPLSFIHQYVDMPKQTAIFRFANGTETKVKGCPPAMGYSFAAGTTDGPGEFDFSQGTLNSNAFWNTIRDFIFPPTPEDVSCHHPKPILINTGKISFPYQWQSRIVSTQLIKIGSIILIAVPGEFTTMSGRRLRNIVRNTAIQNDNITPIITGLSNAYTSYITTPEEYQAQRYEAASTIYGPHTLTIYLKIYKQLTRALITRTTLLPGPTPPNFSSKLITFSTPILFDASTWKQKFGHCIVQPPNSVQRGNTVKAQFISGNPRNNVMHDGTFLAIQHLVNGYWNIVATDADWSTKFIWKRTSHVFGASTSTIEWAIPDDTLPGIYRIKHYGYYKSVLGGIFPYNGSTNHFQVT